MFNVKFADIGEGIHEGVLLKLFVKVGQSVEDGESLFTLETDKVNAEIPSPTDGVIKEIRYAVGDRVHVGEIIVVIDDGAPGVRSNMEVSEAELEAASIEASSASTPNASEVFSEAEPIAEAKGASVVGQIEVSSQLIPSSSEAPPAQSEPATADRRVLATPVARKLAKDLGVDIRTLVGTGPGGRIMKSDIRTAAEAKVPSAVEPQVASKQSRTPSAPKALNVGDIPVERVPMTMLRKTIAENMVLSRFTIPHTTVMDEGDVSELVTFKREVKAIAEEEGVKLTYLAFFVRAVVLGLKAFPYLNASLDDVAGEIVLKRAYHIGIAVDTPDGLMVPVIRNADTLSIFEIAAEIERLSVGAHQRTLKLEELKDSTFSITNYGSVGSSFGVPIIRYPEAGILGVGAIAKKPVVVADKIVIREMLPLSLSFDHRIIDGADAGRFVSEVKRLLSNPRKLLLK